MAGPVTWWANNGNGSSWTKHALEQAFDAAWAVYAADLDGDGDPDILAGGDVGDSGAVVWWQNNGQSWTKHVINADFSGARSVHAADVDGDGDMDILGAAASIDDMTWWANNGNGTAWTEHTIDGRFIGANSVYATDIDNDGDLDVLGTDGVATSDFTWWENTAGNGSSWDKHAQSGSYKVTEGVYAADMDGDNDFDVLVVAYFEHDIAWWENGMSPSTPGPTATKTSTPIATPVSTSTPRPTSTSINTPMPTHTPNTGPPTPTSVPTHIPAPGTGDAYESNDTCDEASTILTDGTVQAHTFHTPGDADWVAFEVTAGTEYIIEALTPADSQADVVMELYDGCNTLPTDGQDYAFSPDVRLQFKAPTSGTYYLQLTNFDLEVAGSDVAYDLSVRGLADEATPGALILVAGRLRSTDSLQRNIHNITNDVYRLFLTNGYNSDQIYYMATDRNIDVDGDLASDVDGLPSRQNLELAITQWAADKVGPERALTLYLIDHGAIDSLYLNGPSQTVSPDDLDRWLDQLEAAVPGVRVNVIVEACHSGSFIDLSNSVSQSGRVIMASTGTYPLAYASEDGAVFSDALVNALGRGMSLYGAFSEARSVSTAAHPDQTPWLDDNGDGLPNGHADGNEAQRRGFTYAGTFHNEQWPPYIMRAEAPAQIVHGEGTIKVEVRDDQGVLSVWAKIYKPSYTPPNPEEAEEMVLETVPTIQLQPDPNRDVWLSISLQFKKTML